MSNENVLPAWAFMLIRSVESEAAIENTSKEPRL